MNQKQILEEKIKKAIREFEEDTGADIMALNLKVTSVGTRTDHGMFYYHQITLDIKL